MCGLPTETDDDVLAIAAAGPAGDPGGPEGDRAAATSAAPCRSGLRAQAAHAVPVGRPVRPRDRRCPAAGARRSAAVRPELRPGDRLQVPRRRAVGDRRPAVPRRPPGRRVIRRRGRTAPGSMAGASTSLTTRWATCAAEALAADGIDLAWYTTRERVTARCCPGITWTPASTVTGCGRTGWPPRAGGAAEVEDCRWTPCYDCGVCPAMGTEIQTGPTGETASARRTRRSRSERDLTCPRPSVAPAGPLRPGRPRTGGPRQASAEEPAAHGARPVPAASPRAGGSAPW